MIGSTVISAVRPKTHFRRPVIVGVSTRAPSVEEREGATKTLSHLLFLRQPKQ